MRDGRLTAAAGAFLAALLALAGITVVPGAALAARTAPAPSGQAVLACTTDRTDVAGRVDTMWDRLAGAHAGQPAGADNRDAVDTTDNLTDATGVQNLTDAAGVGNAEDLLCTGVDPNDARTGWGTPQGPTGLPAP